MKEIGMTRLGRWCAGTVLAASAMVGVGVHATPTFGDGFNGIFFQNYETLFRATADCNAATCEAAVTGDPAGLLRVRRDVVGNINVNDVFVGVINVQNIDSPVQGNTIWSQAIGTDRFTGYFAQRVTAINLVDPTAAVITLAAVAADPFNILAAGEMFAMYYGTTFTTLGTLQDSIDSAISGSLFGTLGIGGEGYAYTLTNLTQLITDSNTEAFLGLNLLTQGPAYNAGDLELMNDFNESLFGGVAAAGAAEICTAADLANAAVICSNFAGTSEIEPNVNYTSGSTTTGSNWQYQSNDPFKFYTAVPEPTSLALVGLALLGLGAARRRRSA